MPLTSSPMMLPVFCSERPRPPGQQQDDRRACTFLPLPPCRSSPPSISPATAPSICLPPPPGLLREPHSWPLHLALCPGPSLMAPSPAPPALLKGHGLCQPPGASCRGNRALAVLQRDVIHDGLCRRPPSRASQSGREGAGPLRGLQGAGRLAWRAVYHLPTSRTGKDPGSRPFLDTCPRVWSGKESRKGALLGVLRPLRASVFYLDMEGI